MNKDIKAILATLEQYLLGRPRQLEYALTCFFAKGHLLIEDVPGVGKTTLAKGLANSVEADFNRVQFTSDLLPSDLIGVTVFHPSNREFEFQPGPLFTNVLLADEINRANPKTQSALLEAMHDCQISHDGKTMQLPEPFFVVATQNAKDNHGTFPLPESQLDRFLMKLELGYPDAEFEKRVMRGDYLKRYDHAARIGLDRLLKLQEAVTEVHVSEDVVEYMYRIIEASRRHEAIRVGVSPRGAQALYRACQSLAFVRGRDFVIPDDVRELTPMVCGHRMILKLGQRFDDGGADSVHQVFREILSNQPAPV